MLAATHTLTAASLYAAANTSLHVKKIWESTSLSSAANSKFVWYELNVYDTQQLPLWHAVVFHTTLCQEKKNGWLHVLMLPHVHFHCSTETVLTNYQTTNFRLFQTERVCRRQFQIWRKWQKQVENTVGKGEIARYEQFLLFPQCFLKACFPEASKGVIVWEWVK